MTSASAAAASASTVGKRARKRWKYGAAAATVVCCSMTSLSQTRYGSTDSPGSARHGMVRRCRSYHPSNAAAAGAGSTLAMRTGMTTPPRPGKPAPRPTPRPEEAPRHPYGPRPVGALLPAITRPAFKSNGPAAAQLLADWPAIVGPALAATTVPRRFAAGTLTLGCTGPVALELQHLSSQLIERVNGHLGRAVVQRLRFVQDTRPPPVPARPRRVRPPVAVDGLPDGPLRDALGRLGAAINNDPA